MWIYNIQNGNKIYIGQTRNPKVRFADHKTKLKCGTHPNRHLQNAYNKAAPGTFVYSLIDEATSDLELDELERKYIIQFNSLDGRCGYNIEKGGRRQGMTRVCPKCHIEKDIRQFNKKSKMRNHRQTYCKICQSILIKDWYRRNSEKHKATVLAASRIRKTA